MMSRGDGAIPRLEPGRAESRSRSHRDTLCQQFRAVMKALTGSISEPDPKTRARRQGEGAAQGFRAAAIGIFRRLTDLLPSHFGTHWEPFTWLRLWEYGDPIGTGLYQDQKGQGLAEELFPHP